VSASLIPIGQRASLNPAVPAVIAAWEGIRFTACEARHAAASFLISRPDVSPLELTRTIGHSDQRTTMNIYGHLLPDSGRRVAASLDAMIEAARAADR
jgi:integrase